MCFLESALPQLPRKLYNKGIQYGVKGMPMNNTVVVITAVATLALAAGALAVRFGEIWGVDDSRMTPAAERGRASGGVRLLFALLLSLLAPCVLAGAHVHKLYSALRLYGAFALFCGTAAYASAFVSLRCGGVAAAARGEIGAIAGRAADLLSFLACIACGALMLREGAAACGFYAVQADQAWTGAALLAAASGLAVRLCGEYGQRIRREGEAAPLCMGGAGIAALVCTAVSAAKKTEMLSPLAPYESVLHFVFAALCALSVLCCALAGGRALRALFARERLFGRKKKAPSALWLLPSAACCAGLAYAGVPRLTEIAGALGIAYTLYALLICWIWLRRVGRALLL